MEIKVEDSSVEPRCLNLGVAIELQRRGRRTTVVLGPGDRVPESIFIRIQQDTGGVIVPRTPIRMQSEDVWPNDTFDVKMSWPRWSRGGRQAVDGHQQVYIVTLRSSASAYV